MYDRLVSNDQKFNPLGGKLSVLKLTRPFFANNKTKWYVIQLLLNLDLVLLFSTDDANLNELRTQIYEFVCTV